MEKSEYDEERTEYPYDNGMIGSVWALKVDCLGNPAGTLGYCFEEYKDYEIRGATGIQVIFPNGEYCGFSAKEQEEFFDFVNYDMRYVYYKFTNVINVSLDFNKGYWKW